MLKVMANLVFNGKDGQALTNSLLVAEKFGKEHRSVLSSIRELIKGGCRKLCRPHVYGNHLHASAKRTGISHVHHES